MSKGPSAPKKNEELKIHGDLRLDPYYWLNDREAPETISYLEAENAYREEEMQSLKPLEEKLFLELKGRIKEDDSSVPYFKNGYWYYLRYDQAKDYPIYCRKAESMEAKEEIMLDANVEASGKDYYQVGGLSLSPDRNWLAYSYDEQSRRIFKIRFRNLSSGEELNYELANSTGSASWSSDGAYIFYTQKDETLRPNKIFRHKIGSPVQDDVLVYEELDPTFICSVYRSKSEKYLIIGSHSTVSNEYRYLPADQPEGEFRLVQPRERDLEYSIAHYGEHWYIRTNFQNAANFKLMRTELDKGLKENWEDLIPHRKEVYLEGIAIFEKYLVLEEREKGLTRLRIKTWQGEDDHYIEFDSETYTAGIGLNPSFESDKLRYGYASLVQPFSVIEYDMGDRSKKLLKEQEVLGDFNANNYREERRWYEAADGKKVPVSLVWRPDRQSEGPQKLLLYGYGSYGHTIEPSFSSNRLSLLDRGFTFAIAHIRGSQYLGREWYEDGKMLHKKNTFSDFICVAEGLVKDGLTKEDRLFAMGGSAGGLLMGTVINWKPALFKAVIAAVPFVDVVTTMLDESIPLTTGEFDEWGNPKNEEYYHYIKSYSPYDNVSDQAYPNLLITTGLHDSQVQYWEPAKWCAKLRDYHQGSNVILMYCNMSTGHGGASGRFEALKETAMEYSFLFWQAGIEK
ncbi:MAG: S9 family peptidase [Bacteroidetes bacterium]|nr:S9 family peptidase [Bacteroidota bacterium]